MENQPSINGRKAMEEELMKGREIANQLLEVLHGDVKEVEGFIMLPFAQDLVRKVLRSFTNTLLLLNTNTNDVSDEVDVATTIKNVSSSVKCTKSEDKDEPCKSFFKAKRRRGCRKRKSTEPTWTKNSSILIEDGYAWRKYGQKMTMKAKYLRNYYRCSHKYDQGCPAIKQVQRVQEDPPLYKTTYCGHHNCKTSLSPEIMLEQTSSSTSSMFLSFSNTFPTKEEYPFTSTKQEHVEMIPDNGITHNQLPSSDYLLLCDHELDFDYLKHVTMLSSTESCQFDYVHKRDLDFDG